MARCVRMSIQCSKRLCSTLTRYNVSIGTCSFILLLPLCWVYCLCYLENEDSTKPLRYCFLRDLYIELDLKIAFSNHEELYRYYGRRIP
jgi:hypothetical protein